MKKITVTKAPDPKKYGGLYEVLVEEHGQSWMTHMTKDTLEYRQLRLKLFAQGVSEDDLDSLYGFGYENGVANEREEANW